MEAWILPTAFEPVFADVLGHGYDTITAHETALRLNADNSFYCGVYPGANVSAGDPSSTVGQWAYLVGTYDRTNWNIYVNGALVGSSPAIGSGALYADSDWAIANGTDGSAGRYFQGGICQVAMYNYALTPSQIRSHYYTGLGGGKLTVSLSETNAILSWPGGTLQQSDTVTGNYSDITNAVSPWTVPIGAAQKFFRIKF